jgi:hypothetical protein
VCKYANILAQKGMTQLDIIAGMKKKHWIILIIVLFLVDTILCTLAIFAGGNTFWNDWTAIEKPSETVAKIVGLTIRDAPGGFIYHGRETSVYVESNSGKIFTCCGNSLTEGWEQVDQKDSNEELFLDRCGKPEDSEIFHLPDEKDRLEVQWCGEFESGRIVYTLRADGTVWFRKIYESPMRTIWLQIAVVAITFVLLGALVILNRLIRVFTN